jgi:CheY-like chemotaxis protein
MARRFIPGTKILVVDDDDGLRNSVERMLEMCGATVVCVVNGQLAKKAILEESDSFHAILTDMEMPVMDGCELAAWTKVSAPSTRVIMWTGRLDRAEGHEADLLLGKPTPFPVIIESFAKLIPNCFEEVAPASTQT